jgi:hypothetical protein
MLQQSVALGSNFRITVRLPPMIDVITFLVSWIGGYRIVTPASLSNVRLLVQQSCRVSWELPSPSIPQSTQIKNNMKTYSLDGTSTGNLANVARFLCGESRKEEQLEVQAYSQNDSSTSVNPPTTMTHNYTHHKILWNGPWVMGHEEELEIHSRTRDFQSTQEDGFKNKEQ